jgi:Flp pilus assembly protein TadD
MKESKITIQTSHGTFVFDFDAEKKNPHSKLPGLLHLAAIDLFEAGKTLQGLELMEHLLLLRPKDPVVLSTLGMALSDLGFNEDALPFLRRAVDELPGEATPLVALGAALARSNNLAEATSALEKALAIDADCPFGLINLAACLVAMGKSLDRAEQMLRRADRLMPHNQSVWLNLGKALAQQGSPGKPG